MLCNTTRYLQKEGISRSTPALGQAGKVQGGQRQCQRQSPYIIPNCVELVELCFKVEVETSIESQQRKKENQSFSEACIREMKEKLTI